MTRILFVLMMTITNSSVVWAWGDLGHSTVGYIAEQKLTAKAKTLVYQIIGTEPLSVSATWPDRVKSDDRYKPFGVYHYLTVPYEYTYQTLPPALRMAKDSETMIGQNPDLLLSTMLTHEQKAMLLRYLVHIVGDVHQPFHVGNGLDMGGNLCDVNFLNPESDKWMIVSLHAAWDDYILKHVSYEFLNRPGPTLPSKRWFGYREFGDMLIQDGTLAVDYATVTQASRFDWYEESRKLHPAAYPDETTITQTEDRPYCKTLDGVSGKTLDGKYNAAKIPKLNETYISNSIITIKKRILSAGYRLAHLLNTLADKTNLPQWNPQVDKDVFEPILLKNETSGKGPRVTTSSDTCL